MRMKDVSVPLTIREIMEEVYDAPFENEDEWGNYVRSNGDLWMLVNPMNKDNQAHGFGDIVRGEHHALAVSAIKKAKEREHG